MKFAGPLLVAVIRYTSSLEWADQRVTAAVLEDVGEMEVLLVRGWVTVIVHGEVAVTFNV